VDVVYTTTHHEQWQTIRNVTGELRGAVYRFRVARHRVLGNPVTDSDRTVGGITLERVVRVVVGLFEKVHANVFFGEVVDRQMPVLVQELYWPAVRYRFRR
jgi:hypothetical protein